VLVLLSSAMFVSLLVQELVEVVHFFGDLVLLIAFFLLVDPPLFPHTSFFPES
jgi:hypothetical protein